MSIFKKLFGGALGGGQSSPGRNAYWIYVRCNACGEAIRVRISRDNDLSPEFEGETDQPTSYVLHKEIVGRNCFRRIQVDMAFDSQRRATEQEIRGGTFISAEDYEAAQQNVPHDTGGTIPDR